MWAAILACAISNWLQEITGIDDGRGRARRTLARIRRELINIPPGSPDPPDDSSCGHHREPGPGYSITC